MVTVTKLGLLLIALSTTLVLSSMIGVIAGARRAAR
jgi:hypothetical protein